MTIQIEKSKYYRSAEVCQIAGIAKSTLFRWINDGVISEVERRDRRGWRLFSQEELEAIQREANLIIN